MEYVAKVQLVQNYTSEIDVLMTKLRFTQEEVTIAVGEREKSNSYLIIRYKERD
jgi:hypothetical protein